MASLFYHLLFITLLHTPLIASLFLPPVVHFGFPINSAASELSSSFHIERGRILLFPELSYTIPYRRFCVFPYFNLCKCHSKISFALLPFLPSLHACLHVLRSNITTHSSYFTDIRYNTPWLRGHCWVL